jgi:uncharacterized membrane protein YraQ (UPF0718 family)
MFSIHRIDELSLGAKAAMVAGGYAAAAMAAFGAVWIYAAASSRMPGAAASSGMAAFGDALAFLALFGCFSAVPTALAVVFLRRSRIFWLAASIAIICGLCGIVRWIVPFFFH